MTTFRAPYTDPNFTAKGEARATVQFNRFKTLWVNTGTLCNIECVGCYIESSPLNDRLVYLTPADLEPYLDELDAMGQGPIEIGFTGGEPCMNPHIATLLDLALARGHRVLVLTNAMQPMLRPRVKDSLLQLRAQYGDRLALRVSLDHYTENGHDEVRGEGGFAITLGGVDWLVAGGFPVSLASRGLTGESEVDVRAGFAALITQHGWPMNADDPAQLIVFPEMDVARKVPEITPACWGILNVNPDDMMCSSSRMVVKRKGAASAAVVACTLLPYEPQFELGARLADSLAPVKLSHPHCAQFCVLGGGACSA